MNEQQLDFKEPSKVCFVPNQKFFEFSNLLDARGIKCHDFSPKRHCWRLTLSAPVPEDIKHLTCEAPP